MTKELTPSQYQVLPEEEKNKYKEVEQYRHGHCGWTDGLNDYWKDKHVAYQTRIIYRLIDQSDHIPDTGKMIKTETVEEALKAFRVYEQICGELCPSLSSWNAAINWQKQQSGDWSKLAAIAPPEKWEEMYRHYQELLTGQDVSGFWQEQFEIQKQQFKDKLKEILEYVAGEAKVMDIQIGVSMFPPHPTITVVDKSSITSLHDKIIEKFLK